MKFSNDMLWFTPAESFAWTGASGDISLRQYGDRKVEMTKFEHGFLCALLRQKRPQKIVEVGVAAGGTTCILLKALQLADIDAEMHSIDLATRYYANSEYATGYMVEQSFDPVPLRWVLHTGQVAGAVMDSIGDDIDFCILDTAHSLPGEVLDFLTVLPYLQDGAVVILHDVNLHLLHKGLENAYATKIVLDYAEGEKIYPEDESNICSLPNIAAIVVNAQTRKQVGKMFAALYLPWAYMPGEKDIQHTVRCMEQHYTVEEMLLYKNAVNIHFHNRQQVPPFPAAMLQKKGERGCYGAAFAPQGINVCYAADEAFVQHMAVSLCSLLMNAKESERINVFLFTNYVSYETLNKLLCLQEIKNHALEVIFVDKGMFSQVFTSGHVNEISYYRLIMAELLPPNINKALYIDCDTVVLRSLTALYDMDVSMVVLGAVRDYVENSLVFQLLDSYDVYKDYYFNAGVLLMNVDAMRRMDLFAKAQKFINKFPIIHLWDQDVLNALIPQDEILFLDFSCNFQCYGIANMWEDRSKLSRELVIAWQPRIMHFLTSAKPWNNEYLHIMGDSMVRKYYYYLGFTPWREFVPDNGFYLPRGLPVTVFSLAEPCMEEALFDKLAHIQPCLGITIYSRHGHLAEKKSNIQRCCVQDPLREAAHMAEHFSSGIIIVLLPWGYEQGLLEQARQSLVAAPLTSCAVENVNRILPLYKRDGAFSPFTACENLPNLNENPTVQKVHHGQATEGASQQVLSMLRYVRNYARIFLEQRYIKSTGMFDAVYYLGIYEDVLAEKKDALHHYLEYGAVEGRKPNLWFDTQYYVQRYPDVAQSIMNPFYHYLKYGAVEKRQCKP